MPEPAKFLGNTIGDAASFAAGLAVGEILRPAVQIIGNQAWNTGPTKPLDAEMVADAVARGHIEFAVGQLEAQLSGISKTRFQEMIKGAHGFPGQSDLFALWRRGEIEKGQFAGGLKLGRMPDEWIAELEKLYTSRLAPADVAYAIVRGLMDDAGLLPVPPPKGGTTIKRFPVSGLDPIAEAEAMGLDRERLRILVGRSGLSLAPVTAANAYFRGLINENDAYLAIAEGDLRNEWRDTLIDVSRQILTAENAADLELRGYIERDKRLELTRAHGMTDANSDLLYNLLGRSIAVHAVATGEARGGVFEGPTETIPKAYLQAMQRSNLRPEYYSLAYANRFQKPSAFFIRQLLTTGAITAKEGEQQFLELAWEPELAKIVAENLAKQATGPKGDPWVNAARTQARNALHKRYMDELTDASGVLNGLSQLGVSDKDAQSILDYWTLERLFTEKVLTPAQVKKAYQAGQYTQDEAISALIQQHYSAGDAFTYLTT